mgnify:CR=1 FL=1
MRLGEMEQSLHLAADGGSEDSAVDIGEMSVGGLKAVREILEGTSGHKLSVAFEAGEIRLLCERCVNAATIMLKLCF